MTTHKPDITPPHRTDELPDDFDQKVIARLQELFGHEWNPDYAYGVKQSLQAARYVRSAAPEQRGEGDNRLKAHIDYSIDLQRIIEAICHGYEIPTPKTTARHHYKMASEYIASRNLLKAAEPDLSKCPGCGGPADNGHDRCVPPTPYYCSKCATEPGVDVDLASYILAEERPDFIRDLNIIESYGEETERISRIKLFINRIREMAVKSTGRLSGDGVMACDLCGKVTDENEVLMDSYQTSAVKVLCKSCMKKANKKLDFYRYKMVERLMKRYFKRIKK